MERMGLVMLAWRQQYSVSSLMRGGDGLCSTCGTTLGGGMGWWNNKLLCFSLQNKSPHLLLTVRGLISETRIQTTHQMIEQILSPLRNIITPITPADRSFYQDFFVYHHRGACCRKQSRGG